jgi:hypothetical protein
MFFIARQAAATLAGRLGRTITISTSDRSTARGVYQSGGGRQPGLAGPL